MKFMHRFINFLRVCKHSGKAKALNAILNVAKFSVVRHARGRVCSGHFQSMFFHDQDVFGSAIAKILGTYEKELIPTLEKIKDTNPALILNIGGAEGFYAVGCTTKWPGSRAIVYEALSEGRRLIELNSRMNGVSDLVEIRGICDQIELKSLLLQQPADVMIMDVEGAELALLSNEVVEALEHSILLIESHDFCQPDCINILLSKFKSSHDIEVIRSRIRDASDFPYSSWMPAPLKTRLMDEMRPENMKWLIGFPNRYRKAVNKQ